MKCITTEEFYAMIAENPSVFEHLETPLKITGYVDCNNCPITHLSKHLIFSGKHKDDWSANFSYCKSLQIATGTFNGFVTFGESGVQKIENLHITKPCNAGWAASFENCKSLQIATGHYPGFVDFEGSGVKSIQNLHIGNTDINGNFVAFYHCSHLHSLEGWDLSKKTLIEPEKLKAEIKRRASLQKFVKETQAKTLPFL
jgi:hypothetical protein